MEGTTVIDTVAKVFTSAGEVMTGFVGMGIDFVGELLTHPVGIVVVLLPLGIKAGNWMLKKFKGR